VDGVARFLHRVWRQILGEEDEVVPGTAPVSNEDLARKLHETIEKVTRDVEVFHFNTAMSAMMELTNAMQDYLQAGASATRPGRRFCRDLARMLGPFAPTLPKSCGSVLAARAWSRLKRGRKPTRHLASRPGHRGGPGRR